MFLKQKHMYMLQNEKVQQIHSEKQISPIADP